MNSTNTTGAIDAAHVPSRLRELLHRLLVQNKVCPFATPDAIPLDAELSTLGITSIDFLEYTLTVENEFRVEILDAITPDELPQTLAAWQQLVVARMAS